ncbi:histidine kinase [Psychrosphaera sp. 1_MG-2023]|uniref:histidine kinase n=1 Tax=Psychrosphaera sp. 1_MG-2023 TaxID=3062643 RepID=UPI0026E3FE12|nr:histidine kinase [Psychrosphaera sp. 1_MG-2023]MDO6719476.1 histidine kinase [Psychrosphaera sp. 1_MG-2023]
MLELKNELLTWLENHPVNLITQYAVPMLGEGGSCSLFGELAAEPFDLTNVLNTQQLVLLKQVQAVVDWVKYKTAVDWFGVYLTRSDNNDQKVLTKLAYFGEPSRAEFPLTPEFATISNNSFVGLYGEKRTINDVQKYVADGGEYYTCDPKVKSELCWPILSPNSLKKVNDGSGCTDHIIGIIDAECFSTDSFDADKQAVFEVVCEVLGHLFSNSKLN